MEIKEKKKGETKHGYGTFCWYLVVQVGGRGESKKGSSKEKKREQKGGGFSYSIYVEQQQGQFRVKEEQRRACERDFGW